MFLEMFLETLNVFRLIKEIDDTAIKDIRDHFRLKKENNRK